MTGSLQYIVDIFRVIVDVAIVGIVMFTLLKLIRNNARMLLLFKGIITLVIVKFIVDVLNLATISFLIDYIISQGFIIVIIIFQPEIRSALELLGRNNLFFGKHKKLSIGERDVVIKELTTAVNYMAQRKIGAIITLEQNESMYEFISKGHRLFSDLTAEILESIFYPASPLHDGAVIIQGNKIACAKAYFPITQNGMVSDSFGTRHRAAIGVSEVSDCITIIISEELGTVSLTHRGVIYYDLTMFELEKNLRDLYLEEEVVNEFENQEEEIVSIYEEDFHIDEESQDDFSIEVESQEEDSFVIEGGDDRE